MTGCVVLVMSSCHDKYADRLWCYNLWFISRHHKNISNHICIKMS